MASISQIPAPLDMTLVAGDRFNFSATLCNPLLDGEGNPVLDVSGNPQPDPASPLDLTDAVVTAQIRQRVADVDPLAAFENPNAASLGPDGVVQVRLTETESVKLRSIATAVWDLQVLWPDSRGVQTMLAGTVSIVMDVTR